MICEDRYARSGNLTGSDMTPQMVEDYLDCLSSESFKNRIGVIVYLLFVVIVGFLGNVLVIFVYTFGFKPSATRAYILALAILDIATNIVAMPLQIITIRYAYNFTSLWLCQMLFAFATIPTQASGLVLVVVALDRLHKVWKPHQHHLSEGQAICVTFIVVVMINCLFGFLVKIYQILRVDSPIPGVQVFMCWPDVKKVDPAYLRAYQYILFILFFGGFATMFIAYMMIAFKVRMTGTRERRPVDSQMYSVNKSISSLARIPGLSPAEIPGDFEEPWSQTSQDSESRNVDENSLLQEPKSNFHDLKPEGLSENLQQPLSFREESSPVTTGESRTMDLPKKEMKPRAHSLPIFSKCKESTLPTRKRRIQSEEIGVSIEPRLNTKMISSSLLKDVEQSKKLRPTRLDAENAQATNCPLYPRKGINRLKGLKNRFMNLRCKSNNAKETVSRTQEVTSVELTSDVSADVLLLETDSKISGPVTSGSDLEDLKKALRMCGQGKGQALCTKEADENKTFLSRPWPKRRPVSSTDDDRIGRFSSLTVPAFLGNVVQKYSSTMSHFRESLISQKSVHISTRTRLIRSRTTLIMVVLTIFYVVNWLPHLIVRMLYKQPVNWCPNFTECGLKETIYAICLRSVYFNSAVNAFVYGVCCSHFRRACLMLFNFRKKWWK